MRRAPVKDARRSPSSRNRRAELEPTQDRGVALSAARAVNTEAEFPVGAASPPVSSSSVPAKELRMGGHEASQQVGGEPAGRGGLSYAPSYFLTLNGS